MSDIYFPLDYNPENYYQENYWPIENSQIPKLITISGIAKKANGEVSSEIILVLLSIDGSSYGSSNQVRDDFIYITPNATTGEWSVNLYDTETMQPGSFYIFYFGKRKEYKTVMRKKQFVNYNDLEDYAA